MSLSKDLEKDIVEVKSNIDSMCTTESVEELIELFQKSNAELCALLSANYNRIVSSVDTKGVIDEGVFNSDIMEDEPIKVYLGNSPKVEKVIDEPKEPSFLSNLGESIKDFSIEIKDGVVSFFIKVREEAPNFLRSVKQKLIVFFAEKKEMFSSIGKKSENTVEVVTCLESKEVLEEKSEYNFVSMFNKLYKDCFSKIINKKRLIILCAFCVAFLLMWFISSSELISLLGKVLFFAELMFVVGAIVLIPLDHYMGEVLDEKEE